MKIKFLPSRFVGPIRWALLIKDGKPHKWNGMLRDVTAALEWGIRTGKDKK